MPSTRLGWGAAAVNGGNSQQRERAAMIASRRREGIEISDGEKIVLDRIEKERQARFEASRERQAQQRLDRSQSSA
jgi:hypothetical protein